MAGATEMGPFAGKALVFGQFCNRGAQTVGEQAYFFDDGVENIDECEMSCLDAIRIADIFQSKQILEITEVLDGPPCEIIIAGKRIIDFFDEVDPFASPEQTRRVKKGIKVFFEEPMDR
tara:strand:- start:268 stop:624 length:357 start_codon:yes stop_codon:yes gene_type:complete